MSGALTLACFWVLAATATAFLPMRRQYAPGLALLIAAPGVLGWIGWQHGVWVALLGGLAFVSMFRNPLIYFARKAMGYPAAVPQDPKPEVQE